MTNSVNIVKLGVLEKDVVMNRAEKQPKMGFVNLRWYKNPFAQPNNPAIGLKNG